ncbi:uncharacterized protein LOC132382904 [Hypanus sabinus]|uniref:uncharacterized protein LOC132382904 n=1 Tax=Hypanus sabinus TaxID=79690 RepID=UPI0028C37831|nr:uncharacterized protein LOC132382904 [Hypanus sabinus]XP_059809430.1 uncharacterized protein LOC132382904 [Hypanus sabinus]XP_059809431.1 uncharacterized protein LOC132382904 [Hypanus sabinus]XP_059809432.1 uncharacterized protein LOC132382904 [Hypanus sabinus]
MADSTSVGEEMCSLTVLKSETKLIMEAFLRRVQMEGAVGHVGRYYHDEKKYKAQTPDSQDSISVKVHKHRRSLWKGTLEREDEEKWRSLKHSQGTEDDTGWGTSDEEICQAEEKKHGFKTAIKKLIKRKKKRKGSSTLEKSKDSLDFVETYGPLAGTTKPDSKANSLKGQENTITTTPESNFAHVEGLEGSVSEGVNIREESSKHKKTGQWFLNLIRKGPKKSGDNHPEKDQVPSRPTTLALNLSPTEDVNSEFYSEAAKKLEKLAQKCFTRTGNDQLSPSIHLQGPVIANNNVHQSAIEKIVQVLQDQGDKINEKVKDDPILQRPMSFRSFKQLVEAFTANVEGQMEGQASSPELAKIALTMELTRRVAGISSHPVQQLMGYSMQYMDMFVPWLQEQGGWKKVLPLDDFSKHPID